MWILWPALFALFVACPRSHSCGVGIRRDRQAENPPHLQTGNYMQTSHRPGEPCDCCRIRLRPPFYLLGYRQLPDRMLGSRVARSGRRGCADVLVNFTPSGWTEFAAESSSHLSVIE